MKAKNSINKMPTVYINIGGNEVSGLGDAAVTNGTGMRDASPRNAKIVALLPIARRADTIDPKRVKKPMLAKTIT